METFPTTTDLAFMNLLLKKHIHLTSEDKEDIVNTAIIKILSAQSKKPPTERRITREYQKRTILSVHADWTEKKVQEQALKQGIFAHKEPSLEEESAFETLVLGSDLFTRALVDNTSPYGDWNTMTPSAWRKARSRRIMDLKADLLVNWILSGDYDKLNNYRPAEAVCRKIAQLLVDQEKPVTILEPLFDNTSHNRAIQTATWVMTYVGQIRPTYAKRVWSFLEAQLAARNLFRGNLTYISEALLEADPIEGAEAIKRLYLPVIEEMKGRVQADTTPFKQQAPVSSLCIYDVKQVKRIGDSIPLCAVERIKNLYSTGVSDVDLHRSLAFVLLRTRPGDSGGLELVINALRHETDQVNAYYVTRYIMNWGLKEAPHLLSKQTLESLRSVAGKWPQNHYFRESCSRFARKLGMCQRK